MVVLIILGLFTVIVVALVLVNTIIGNASDVAQRSISARHHVIKQTFVTTLPPSAALATLSQATQTMGSGASISQIADTRLAIQLRGGSQVEVTAAVQASGGAQLRITSKCAAGDEEAAARFRGALLSALRERDGSARQK